MQNRILQNACIIFFIFICSSSYAQNSNGFKDGIKITLSKHFEHNPDIFCTKSDSNFIKKYSDMKWVIYVRGNQMRLEYPSQQFDYNGNGIKIYQGANDLNSYTCFETKYFNYYLAIDSTIDQIRIVDDYRHRKRFEKLSDTMTISGYKCKSGIIHDTYQKWLVYYTEQVSKIRTPHKLELGNNTLLQHQIVPQFIVQRIQIRDQRDTIFPIGRVVTVEIVESIEHLQLHDSLFNPPSNYLKFETWESARKEHMKLWQEDLDRQPQITQKEKEAYYGHWVYEDDYGTNYLNIQPNENPKKYGDTVFVKDFMFRKNERSSGTIGKWKTKMMGRTLFHEFSRSWTLDASKDLLVLNGNSDYKYRRASKKETEKSLRECDLVWAAWDMADSLKKWGYDKIFSEKEGALADSLWNMTDGEEILKRVAYRNGSNRTQRFLAAEIVFRKDKNYPPKEDKQLLHDLSHAYANALSYDYAPYGEYWGSLEHDSIGICGEHLLRIGKAAIPELTQQTLNQEFDFYLDYKSGYVGTQYGARKKDHAAFFISRLLNEPYIFNKDKEGRNTDIEILREKLNSFGSSE
jgi:hypothetical protein